MTAYHEIQSHRVVEHAGTAGSLDRFGDLEPTGGQDDGERDPETAVRGQSSGTEGVSDSHFPATGQSASLRMEETGGTYHMPASS